MTGISHERQTPPERKLYALVDGFFFEQHTGEYLAPALDRRALLAGTHDEPLAHAGPWLIDAVLAGDEFCTVLIGLERKAPAVSWIFADLDLDSLSTLLQALVDMRITGGNSASLRFWDPRILSTLTETLEPSQHDSLFGYIHEWHFLRNGKRTWIGRQDADDRR